MCLKGTLFVLPANAWLVIRDKYGKDAMLLKEFLAIACSLLDMSTRRTTSKCSGITHKS